MHAGVCARRTIDPYIISVERLENLFDNLLDADGVILTLPARISRPVIRDNGFIFSYRKIFLIFSICDLWATKTLSFVDTTIISFRPSVVILAEEAIMMLPDESTAFTSPHVTLPPASLP